MSDNSADSLDHASDVEQAFRDAALKAARTEEPVPKDFDGESCHTCGLDIPAPRLALGKFRCVECQTLKEKNAKLNRSY